MVLPKRNKGFTLVELLLAVYILSVSIVGILLLFSQSILSTEYAWDKTIAVSHAEGVLEEMQLRDTLSDIISTDWPRWAQSQGYNILPGEWLDVVLGDTTTDPLVVQVAVHWVRKERQGEVTLKTQMTK